MLTLVAIIVNTFSNAFSLLILMMYPLIEIEMSSALPNIVSIILLALFAYTTYVLRKSSEDALKRTCWVWVIYSMIMVVTCIMRIGAHVPERVIMVNATMDMVNGLNVLAFIIFLTLSCIFLIKQDMYVSDAEKFSYFFMLLLNSFLGIYPIQYADKAFLALPIKDKLSSLFTCMIFVIPMMLNFKRHFHKATHEENDREVEQFERECEKQERRESYDNSKRPPVTREYIDKLRHNIEDIENDLISRGYDDKRDPDLFNEIRAALYRAEYAMMTEDEEDGLYDACDELDKELQSLTMMAAVIRSKLREEEIKKETEKKARADRESEKQEEKKNASNNSCDIDAILNANTINPKWGTYEMNSAVLNAAKLYGIILDDIKTLPAAEREKIIKNKRGKLINVYHPDDASGGDTTQAAAVNKAYEILSQYSKMCMGA